MVCRLSTLVDILEAALRRQNEPAIHCFAQTRLLFTTTILESEPREVNPGATRATFPPLAISKDFLSLMTSCHYL